MAMIQVTIHEAKTHLSRLIQQALDGEEVIIARDKQPLVKLSVLPEAQQVRRIGGAAHVVVQIAPDFDAPLQEFKDYMP
jgi:antitoxin (DNA-binding transcriptional repressor) of toxin-antitoxin stability system